jgi:hypothetical protein
LLFSTCAAKVWSKNRPSVSKESHTKIFLATSGDQGRAWSNGTVEFIVVHVCVGVVGYQTNYCRLKTVMTMKKVMVMLVMKNPSRCSSLLVDRFKEFVEWRDCFAVLPSAGPSTSGRRQVGSVSSPAPSSPSAKCQVPTTVPYEYGTTEERKKCWRAVGQNYLRLSHRRRFPAASRYLKGSFNLFQTVAGQSICHGITKTLDGIQLF